MPNILVPKLPESVAHAVVAEIHFAKDAIFAEGDVICELETDKIMLEVPAESAGQVTAVKVAVGDQLQSDAIIIEYKQVSEQPKQAKEAAAEPSSTASASTATSAPAAPSVRKEAFAHGIELNNVAGSGKGGRILKSDISAIAGNRAERRVPMTQIRMKTAERLLEVQQNSAILTTFNEVNMQPVMDLRKQYKDQFEKTHGVRLGFMSFFIKAAIAALKEYPAVNAAIDGTDIVYHEYVDIGVAVSTKRGLVVPILKSVDMMSMAEIELTIADFANKAKTNKLSLDDLMGGTFSITNGGVFGSMMSTSILNPPHSAILGMHNSVERAMVVNGEIKVLPMMYLAISYDHRIIDGNESVRFLVKIKQMLEDPARLLLEV